jgi:hypothetical protein
LIQPSVCTVYLFSFLALPMIKNVGVAAAAAVRHRRTMPVPECEKPLRQWGIANYKSSVNRRHEQILDSLDDGHQRFDQPSVLTRTYTGGDDGWPPIFNFRTETTMTDQKRKLPLPMEKLAFTIQEAATASSLGQTSLYQAIKDKKLVIRKFGTRSVIRRDDLETFLDSLPVG